MRERFSFKPGYRGRTIFLILNYLFMAIVFLSMLIPLLKVLSDSFEGNFTYGFKIFPERFTLEAYKQVFRRPDIYGPFGISVLTTVIGTVLSMLLTTLAGYVLMQQDMPGRNIFSMAILITMVFNAGMIPTFLVMKQIYLLDTIWAAILPIAVNTYNIILMRNFFETVPPSLAESASLDGCTPLQIFYKIMLPLSKPALATVGLFTLVNYWNEYMQFVLYINDPDLYNLQIILRKIVLAGDEMKTSGADEFIFSDTLKNATIIVSIIPVLLVYPFLQKYFVQGINLGATKE